MVVLGQQLPRAMRKRTRLIFKALMRQVGLALSWHEAIPNTDEYSTKIYGER